MRFLWIPLLLFTTFAQAYPVIVKIENSRDNVLFLRSEKLGQEVKILKGKVFELVVQADDDWRVQYASGAAGTRIWNLDDNLAKFIQGTLAGLVSDRDPLFVITLTLTPLEVGYTWTSYTLAETSLINARMPKLVFTRVHKQLRNPTVRSAFPSDFLAVDSFLTTLSHSSNTLHELLAYARAQREAMELPVAPRNATESAAGEVTRQLLANPEIPPINAQVIAELVVGNMASQ